MALQGNDQWVSPTILKSTLTFPLTPEEKIRIFEDRVIGWQLSIALTCYQTVPHGGFGALYISLSYFELMARYREGSVDHANAGAKFRAGFEHFARHTGFFTDPNYGTVRSLMYEGARCGLYHVGMTSKRVFIEGGRPHMFNYTAAKRRLVIDPGQLITAITDHFRAYTAELRAGADATLLSNFLRKFDHDILPQFGAAKS